MIRLSNDIYEKYDNYKYNGQSALLQSIKDVLLKKYPRTNIRGDGQVVCVDFSDGISFEIIPVFYCSVSNKYLYPDTHNNGSWKTTDPIIEQEKLNYLNNNVNNKTKNLAKLIRAWKDYNNVNISGIEIDSFVYEFINEYNYINVSYAELTKDFFKFLYNYKKTYIKPFDGSYTISINNSNFYEKAKKAYNKSYNAIISNDSDYWRDIYGQKF